MKVRVSTMTDVSDREPDGVWSDPGRIAVFRRGELVFPVQDTGPLDGEPVLLLHGWPQDSRSWAEVAELLNQAGYRTFAPDLRGASKTAAPRRRWAYRLDEVAADVVSMVEQIGRPVHVAGHDWGAAAAWAAATTGHGGIASLTALSVPHPGAFVRSMLTTRQGLASWYMYVFQLPVLPERILRTELFLRLLRQTGQPAEVARRDSDRLRDKVIARGGLNWYRGMLLSSPRFLRGRVRVPVLQVWSDGDTAVLEHGPRRSGRYVDAPFRFEVVPGVSHWLPDEAPGQVVKLLTGHFAAIDGDS